MLGLAMTDPASCPLLTQHEALVRALRAWTEAWQHRRDSGSATMVALASTMVNGEPLATRVDKRLLLAKAHLEARIATQAGDVAHAIAQVAGEDDTTAIRRAATEAVTRVGHADEDFASKLAELVPMVDAYRRLRAAIG
jgi:hypothetical protein